MNVCMFTVSNALLKSNATAIVCVVGRVGENCPSPPGHLTIIQ